MRVFDGTLRSGENLHLIAANADVHPMEIGSFAPRMLPGKELQAGEVGYVATGLKTVRECRVGDTFTTIAQPATEALPGYRHPKPMVFAGFYPVEGEDYANLKDALEKLQLNDASLVFEPDVSQALNYGFRCGFLGMFHMEIIQERLEREHEVDLIATAPSVEYEVLMIDGSTRIIEKPADLPEETQIAEVREPWMRIQVFTPEEFYGTVMDLATKRRAIFVEQEYPAPQRVVLHFDIPLAELIVEFYDQLKARTRGYASLDYHFIGYRADDLVKLELLVNEEPVDALAMIVHKKEAYHKGQRSGHQAERAHPAADVRRADPGHLGRARDLPRQRQADSQGCAGEVLRRRHLPQEEAARETEEGQEAHEARRQRGDPSRGLYGHSEVGGRVKPESGSLPVGAPTPKVCPHAGSRGGVG